jgi:hypothetical protein
LATDWRTSGASGASGDAGSKNPERRDLVVSSGPLPSSLHPLIPLWLRQCGLVVAYVWGFALFLALGTKGCDWVSEPSSAKVALGLASVVAAIFGAAMLVSQIVRKAIEAGRNRRVR